METRNNFEYVNRLYLQIFRFLLSASLREQGRASAEITESFDKIYALFCDISVIKMTFKKCSLNPGRKCGHVCLESTSRRDEFMLSRGISRMLCHVLELIQEHCWNMIACLFDDMRGTVRRLHKAGKSTDMTYWKRSRSVELGYELWYSDDVKDNVCQWEWQDVVYEMKGF